MKQLLIYFQILFFCVQFTEKLNATLSFSDIENWTGSGTNEAALVIDWEDGQPSLVWGYRWGALETRTGMDMIEAVANADPNLDLDISPDFGGYVRGISYNRVPDPDSSESYDFLDPFLGFFWSYNVNATQAPGVFDSTAHGPPNGDPYGGGGVWNNSNTGARDRPLSNGSWDGWLWATPGGSSLDNEPIPVPIPEPKSLLYLIFACLFYLQIRKRG